MNKKTLHEFWMQSATATFGTVVGIILTFGTTFYQQNSEQKQMERKAALMVIDNLDDFYDKMAKDVKDLAAADSLNYYVLENLDRLNKIPDDTLNLFLNNFAEFSFSVYDNTTENIFTTNIDTWKNVGNDQFVEKAGKCFALKKMLIATFKERQERQTQVYDTLIAISVCSDKPLHNTRKIVRRFLKSQEVRLFINRQHRYYVTTLKMGLEIMKDQNKKNKELMQVTDEELHSFGETSTKYYHNERK